jgi:hypothetical protein
MLQSVIEIAWMLYNKSEVLNTKICINLDKSAQATKVCDQKSFT